jgi:hypothetical protein
MSSGLGDARFGITQLSSSSPCFVVYYIGHRRTQVSFLLDAFASGPVVMDKMFWIAQCMQYVATLPSSFGMLPRESVKREVRLGGSWYPHTKFTMALNNFEENPAAIIPVDLSGTIFEEYMISYVVSYSVMRFVFIHIS